MMDSDDRFHVCAAASCVHLFLERKVENSSDAASHLDLNSNIDVSENLLRISIKNELTGTEVQESCFTKKPKYFCDKVFVDGTRVNRGVITDRTKIVFCNRNTLNGDSRKSKELEDILGTYDSVCRERISCFLKKGFETNETIYKPRSLLVYGDPGTGKSTLVRHVCASHNFEIVEVDLLSFVHVEADVLLRRLVDRNPGCVILIDNADCFLGKKYGISDLLLLQLISLFNKRGLNYKEVNDDVVFIVVANEPSNLHPSLVRCFDDTVEIHIPDQSHRLLIWESLIGNRDLALEFNKISNGFVGGDISYICEEATYDSQTNDEYIERIRKSIENREPACIGKGAANWTVVSSDSIQVSFDDIGGLEDVKQSLCEMLVWPRMYKNDFIALNIKAPVGVLLHGPPGTGKTMLASAVAKQTEANFLSISIVDIIRGEIGESEKAVANVFKVARRISPCVLFFDEFQALFSNRSESGSVGRKLVSQLLLEMDELELVQSQVGFPEKRIMLIAATNVPESIDSALLRPGRFDRLIYVPVPDESARKKILQTIRARMGCWGDDVDLDKLVSLTPFKTGADLKDICTKAAVHAFKEATDSENQNVLLQFRHFELVLKLKLR